MKITVSKIETNYLGDKEDTWWSNHHDKSKQRSGACFKPGPAGGPAEGPARGPAGGPAGGPMLSPELKNIKTTN